jgi:diguanylate cyclase (GGDEF)-like protein/PAS domain S-box-containing protein
MTPKTLPKSDGRVADPSGNGRRRGELLAIERNVRLILENTSDLIAMLDTRGRRLYNSPSYHALFGDKELTGTDSFSEIHPDDRERVREIFRKTILTGVGQRTRYRFALSDGSVRYIESQGNVVRDKAGNVAQVVVISRDITERLESEHALHESNRQLQATVHELERRNRDNAILGNMGDMLQMCKSVQESNGVLAQFIDKLFPNTSGNFYLLNVANNLLEAVVTWGEAGLTGDPVIGKDDCWALRRGQLHVTEDSHSKLSCQHLISQPRGPYFCAPIQAQGDVLGMLHVQFDKEEQDQSAAIPQGRSESRKAWALAVAEHLSLALANLKLRETLRVQAVRDSLTDLYNRRYMEQVLDREVLRASRNHRTVGIIMLDLDHFKRFNDTYGHEAGDLLLRVVGDFLTGSVRAEDIACRYGGEEFVVMLPEASLSMTQNRAEQLCKGMRSLGVNVRGELLRGVTVSIGVAAFPEDGGSVSDLLRAADMALYAAKHHGRDRVVVAEKTLPLPPS